MAVFLDSGFFVALLNKRDVHYEDSLKISRKLAEKSLGRRVTTDYILDEVITTLWYKVNRKDIVVSAYKLIHDEQVFVKLEYVTSGIFELAWKKWNALVNLSVRPLSFTDCSVLAFMEVHDVDNLISFDKGFKGLVKGQLVQN